MADRQSADIFGTIFDLLASKKTLNPKIIAKNMWLYRRDYDFSTSQMECDDSLIKLGLAKKGKDEYGDDVILYKGEDY